MFATREVPETEFNELMKWREQHRTVVKAVEVLLTAPMPPED